MQRNRQGHYIPNGQINEQKVVFMPDTGAMGIAVSEYLVEKLNLERGSSIELRAANDRATGYMTNIELIRVGDIELKHTKAMINPNGKEGMKFLGMSFLKKIEFTQRGDELTLLQRSDQ